MVIATLIGSIFFIFLNKNEPKSLDLNPSTATSSKETNNKAAFAIFTNGTYRIFSDPKYHNLSPDVYIESPNPNIVFIKTKNIKWSDFFNTLPMQLSKDCLVTGTGQKFCTGQGGELNFYINGEKDPMALDREIKNGDKLLVSFGANQTRLEYELSQIPDPK